MSSWKVASALIVALTTAVIVFSLHRATTRIEPDRFAVPARDVAPTPPDAAVSSGSSPEEGMGDTQVADAEDGGEGEGGGRIDIFAVPGTSETFTNTSILIAIRDAGFVCLDIVRAQGGGDDLLLWRIVCDGGLVYIVGVDERAGFTVQPAAYGDGLVPASHLIQPRDPPRGPPETR